MCARACHVHACIQICVCAHVYIIYCPLLPYIMPALPTIRHTAQLPDRPLNPLPGTLTASPWETDPEGPGKHFVHTKPTHPHTHTALIQIHSTHVCTHVFTVQELKDHIAFKTGMRNQQRGPCVNPPLTKTLLIPLVLQLLLCPPDRLAGSHIHTYIHMQ